MTTDTKTPGEWARIYRARNWLSIPIPFKTKKPILDKWQSLRIMETDLPEYFNGEPQNIGVLLGEPSTGLIDIDLDAPEAVQLAPHFLEQTVCRFGRQSKPDSHWIYVASPCESTAQFEDTDGAMLVEYRSTGAQTVFPGSVHPSGEAIKWSRFEDPLPIDGRLLKETAARLAAASLLARHWPGKGSRQKAALALAGGLLRARWQPEDVEHFIHAVGIGACDEELSMRGKAAEYTRRKMQSEQPATGWPALAELVGDKVVDKACKWLGVRAHSTSEGLPGKQKAQATCLVDLADGIDLWHTPDMDTFASVPVDGHNESWPLTSKGFRRWLARRYYQAQGRAPSAQALQDALSVLGGKALFDGPEHRVSTRLAEHDGKIYLDLANRDWEAVEIGRDGWRVIADLPVKFRRAKGMLPIPSPVSGGTIQSLRQFVNIVEDDWPLALGWLVAALRNTGPYPVLVLNGEHGSAKSSAARVLRLLIDPNKADLRSEPKDPRDLMIAATNGLVVAFDNLSHLSTWLSDALCRLATGGGFSTRTLYENDEETIFEAQRPVILNGINEIVTRPDLLDRAITTVCPVILETDRRTEKEFWQTFETARPAILGALLGAVSHALTHVDETALDRPPRMADFAQWAVAAEQRLGMKSGTFMAAYTGNRQAANELVLEASPMVAPLRELVKLQPWEGTATELLVELSSRVSEKTRELKSWPKSGGALSAALRRLAPNLRAVGFDVTFGQTPGSRSRRFVQIRKTPEFSDASDASDASETNWPASSSSQVGSVATPPGDRCDAVHAQATMATEEFLPILEGDGSKTYDGL